MANDDHIAQLKNGVDAWNAWRDENRNIRPDLSEADLHAALAAGGAAPIVFDQADGCPGVMIDHLVHLGITEPYRADLREANLGGADLRESNLNWADFRGAYLHMANLAGADLTGADFTPAPRYDVIVVGGSATRSPRPSRYRSPNLRNATLFGTDLSEAILFEANLTGAYLHSARLEKANLYKANFSGAHLNGADLREANLRGAHLSAADLSAADLRGAYLNGADLTGADLQGANLSEADLVEANFSGADLKGADLRAAQLIDTDFGGADLTSCRIFGISAWRLKLERAKQQNLVITGMHEPEITVDNIEIAQFVYLLLHNEKIRDVIDTIGKKGVLLLGRFTEGRIEILERLREELRKRNFMPMVFNFDKPETKGFTETVRLLAGLSRFVIVDVTNPRSAPLELQATVPECMIPFVPILDRNEGLEPFAMLRDLQHNHPDRVSPVIRYSSVDKLIEVLDAKIIAPANETYNRLLARKAEQLRIVDV
jgi:uncharacterized protein YjbI with pentapeptide repeats